MSKNCGATPFDAGPQFFLWLIFGAPGRRIEQSLKAPSANGSNSARCRPATSPARQADLGLDLQVQRAVTPVSGQRDRVVRQRELAEEVSEPGAYQGKMPFGATPSEATLTKSTASPACSRWPAKLPATPKPNQERSSWKSRFDHGSSSYVPT